MLPFNQSHRLNHQVEIKLIYLELPRVYRRPNNSAHKFLEICYQAFEELFQIVTSLEEAVKNLLQGCSDKLV